MQTDWFKDAELGLFIHWDHASQQGLEISWPMVGYNSDGTRMNHPITIEQYNGSAETFNPVNWNARELAALARGLWFSVRRVHDQTSHRLLHVPHKTHRLLD